MPNSQGPYYPGQGVLVQGEFYTSAGDLTDTSVTVRWKKPDGSVGSSGAATHVSTGVYTYVIDTTGGPDGDWWWRMEGTTPAVGVNEDYFIVRKSRVI